MRPDGQLILPGLDQEQKPWRLLVCYDCYTIEKLPPYTGPEDEHGVALARDEALEHLLEGHRHSDGEPHRGVMLRCDEATWNNMQMRTELSRQLFKEEAERVAFNDTLMEDAMSCFNRHQRPNQGCIDYKDESKRLGVHAQGRRERAAVLASPVYLCDFCVVQSSYVDVQIRKKKGQYT